jgi:hypothetical protein
MPSEILTETEQDEVLRRRKIEALEDGMSVVEARLFSESEIDIGKLRELVATGCPPELLARILL